MRTVESNITFQITGDSLVLADFDTAGFQQFTLRNELPFRVKKAWYMAEASNRTDFAAQRNFPLFYLFGLEGLSADEIIALSAADENNSIASFSAQDNQCYLLDGAVLDYPFGDLRFQNKLEGYIFYNTGSLDQNLFTVGNNYRIDTKLNLLVDVLVGR